MQEGIKFFSELGIFNPLTVQGYAICTIISLIGCFYIAYVRNHSLFASVQLFVASIIPFANTFIAFMLAMYIIYLPVMGLMALVDAYVEKKESEWRMVSLCEFIHNKIDKISQLLKNKEDENN